MKLPHRFKILLSLALTSILASCGPTPTSSSEESVPSSESSISSSEEASSESSEQSSDSFVPVTSITLSHTSVEIGLKKRITLRASVLPMDATNPEVIWKSSDTEIASVNMSGLVYGWEVGTVTITCSADDGSGVFATCEVTVTEVFAESIDLDSYTADLHPRETHQIYPTINPASVSSKALTYASSDEAVATVSSTGLVTAVAQGNAIVSVTANNGVHSELAVHVTNIPVEGFSLRKKSLSINVDGTYSFAPSFYPESATDHGVAYESANPSIASVDPTGKLTALSVGETDITATSNDGGFRDTCHVTVLPKGQLVKSELSRTRKDVSNNHIFELDSCPSLGSVNALVIPVWFSDSNSFIAEGKRETIREDIRTSFFGSAEETGWHSVKSYYETLSHGNLSFDGTVTSWFNCGLPYTKLATGGTGTLLSSAMAWIERTYPDLDLRQFDSDGNGSIDALCLIYAAPDYASLYSYNSTNLWAYTSWMRETPKVSRPTPNVYLWASYDFLYSPTTAANRTGKSSYGGGNNAHCSVDAHTYIHEMGHVFGLSDYYDYSSQYSPAAGFSMQDANVGGHDPYSAMALGFVEPYIPEDSTTLTISTFEESGDVVLLTPEFNEYGSPFDEYMLLELYSPTGLNEADATYPYSGTSPQGPNQYGIRLWHVDGRLAYSTSSRVFNASQITSDPLTKLGGVTNAMANTYYLTGNEAISVFGKSYADYNELQLIRNDASETYRPKDDIAPKDLFYAGDSFSMDRFSKQFVNGTLLNSKRELGWTFTVESIHDGQATVSFTKA